MRAGGAVNYGCSHSQTFLRLQDGSFLVARERPGHFRYRRRWGKNFSNGHLICFHNKTDILAGDRTHLCLIWKSALLSEKSPLDLGSLTNRSHRDTRWSPLFKYNPWQPPVIPAEGARVSGPGYHRNTDTAASVIATPPPPPLARDRRAVVTIASSVAGLCYRAAEGAAAI